MPETYSFCFMDGLGNDFVIIDARGRAPLGLSAEQVRRLSSRQNISTGGCDQLIVLEDAPNPADACFMRIYNADGGEVEACGNATRCVGDILIRETEADGMYIRTVAGRLRVFRHEHGVSVDMGAPRFDWKDIPLGWECDPQNLPVEEGPLKDGMAVSMGNPHAVFFVEDVGGVDLRTLGPVVQNWQQDGKKLFPEGVNVGVAQIISDKELKLRVFERGVGETLACGTGACAAAAAFLRRAGQKGAVRLHLRGGEMEVTWQVNGRLLMSGPVHFKHSAVAPLDKMLD
jgi:diaminopimelate epimerase